MGARPHPVRVSVQRPDHDDEERLLQQSDHSADHGLQARQGAKVVGRVSVRDTRPPIFTLPINDTAVNCKVDQVVFSVNSHSSIEASAARVDEAPDHSVEDEGQDLSERKATKGSCYFPLGRGRAARLCICAFVRARYL